MPLVRYVPGPAPDYVTWKEVFVDVPTDGSEPIKYLYRGLWCAFHDEAEFTALVARGAWQRATDPDLDMDVGL